MKSEKLFYVSKITNKKYPYHEYINYGTGKEIRGYKDLPHDEYPYIVVSREDYKNLITEILNQLTTNVLSSNRLSEYEEGEQFKALYSEESYNKLIDLFVELNTEVKLEEPISEYIDVDANMYEEEDTVLDFLKSLEDIHTNKFVEEYPEFRAIINTIKEPLQ